MKSARAWWSARRTRTKVILIIVGLFVLSGIANGGKSGDTTNRDAGLAAATERPTGAPAAPATAASTPTPTAPPKSWQIVKTWQGDGIKDTEDFTVGDQWRIDWDYTPGPYGGIIQIFVYDAKTKQLVDLVANTQKAGADSSFQRAAGTYYLKVNATGGWKVDVQDMR